MMARSAICPESYSVVCTAQLVPERARCRGKVAHASLRAGLLGKGMTEA